MPKMAPLWPFTAPVRHRTVPAGSLLWRVHQPGLQAEIFRTDLSSRNPGRFDPSADSFYPFCYAALDDLTALSEVLLRDVAFNTAGRTLTQNGVRGRRLSVVEPLRDLSLISLVSAQDLAAARQDTWLVHAERDQYRDTQLWGRWLRDCSPRADGIIWPSKRQPDGLAITLFGDRCGAEVVGSPLGSRDLTEGEGQDWLNRRLGLLATYVAPPGA